MPEGQKKWSNPVWSPDFWTRHPDIRRFTIPLLKGCLITGQHIQDKIRDRFGEELVPSKSGISRLRTGIRKGKYPNETE